MKVNSLYFVNKKKLEIREEELPPVGENQVLVKTKYSAISAGTELMIYRGEFPKKMPADEVIASLGGELSYPLKYGYSNVGQVVELGNGVEPIWKDKLVFAFNPHEDYYVTNVDTLMIIPTDISLEDAVFLPNMETAVNLVMDAKPMIGEHVVVFGQGIVGLLMVEILREIPLGSLVTLDMYENRREASINGGADKSFDPNASGILEKVKDSFEVDKSPGADLSIEVSGSPNALDQAIQITGYAGRVVFGSWYGTKRADLDLGEAFHRSRIQLVSSQVSTISPELSGRWTKERRFTLAWDFIKKVNPAKYVTHTFDFASASEAFEQIYRLPEETIQVLLRYD